MTSALLAATDAAYLEAFEACRISNENFRHADHIRVAWVSLKREPLQAATPRVIAAVRRFVAHHGHANRYHETMTRLWMHLVDAAMRDGDQPTFAEFVATNPLLLDRRHPFHFYSEERLMSAKARMRWVPPDRAPLPPGR